MKAAMQPLIMFMFTILLFAVPGRAARGPACRRKGRSE